MKKKNRIIIWTDIDLDGIGSYLVVKWSLNENIELRRTTVKKFRNEYENWLKHAPAYDQIFILDLDVSEHKDLVDKPNVCIVDHHTTHTKNAEYKFAKTEIKEYTSCIKLLYRWIGVEQSKEKKLLIALIDDYDGYLKQTPLSRMLNIVFWSYTGDKVKKFVEDFGAGFLGFNTLHKNMISLHEKQLNSVIENLEIYGNDNLKLGDKEFKVYSTFCEFSIDDIGEYMLTKYSADFVIMVNPSNNSIYLRRNADSNAPMLQFAEKICDGGGHSAACGGIVTDKFIQFTKLLRRIQ